MGQGPVNYNQETIDPTNPNGPRIEAIIPYYIYSRAYKYDSVKYENLRAVKEVLENPKRIFWGIRAYSEGGWCYVGKPTELYIKENEKTDFPPNMVFAVYLTEKYEVFDWISEYMDEEDNLSPKNWRERYRSLVWLSTS
ncbi:MAG: hypothetical protein A2Z25_10540 [Planctomycetes bacterium RBG_16_55_9]|nr:MAG: hypothetical protein A2Z25_10540 [Planctomycetes bacterium RBG_16_55_9]